MLLTNVNIRPRLNPTRQKHYEYGTDRIYVIKKTVVLGLKTQNMLRGDSISRNKTKTPNDR